MKKLTKLKIELYKEFLQIKPKNLTNTEIYIGYILAGDKDIQKCLETNRRENKK